MAREVSLNTDLIPYSFNILLGGEVFTFRVDYNDTGKFFTVELIKDNETVCAGEPLIFGRPLFKDVYISGKYPAIDIIPYATDGTFNAVTWDNISQGTVRLLIDEGEKSITESGVT